MKYFERQHLRKDGITLHLEGRRTDGQNVRSLPKEFHDNR